MLRASPSSLSPQQILTLAERKVAKANKEREAGWSGRNGGMDVKGPKGGEAAAAAAADAAPPAPGEATLPRPSSMPSIVPPGAGSSEPPKSTKPRR